MYSVRTESWVIIYFYLREKLIPASETLGRSFIGTHAQKHMCHDRRNTFTLHWNNYQTHLTVYLYIFASIWGLNKLKITRYEKGRRCGLLFNMKQPPWITVLLEKLTVANLVKKLPVFFWNQKFHCHIPSSPPLEPILSYINLSTPSYSI
jgi:hypothetical protein